MAVGRDQGRDDDRRQQADARDAASVRDRIRAVELHHGQPDAGQPDRRDHARPRQAVHVPADDAEDAPDEHAVRMRVGPEVGARRVRAVAVRDGHGDGRRAREHQRDDPDGAPVEAFQHDEHDDRPDEVELLLDGEAPQVPQCRRRERVEVRRTVEHEVPVRYVRERGRAVAAQIAEARALRRDAGRAADHDEQQDQRGQQAAGAPRVEGSEVESSLSIVLVEEHRRDQVAREYEEDVDAQPAAPQATGREVVHDDRRDGKPPQSVEGPNPCRSDAAIKARSMQVAIRASWETRQNCLRER